VSQRRLLMIGRIVLGLLLLRQGATVLSGLPYQVGVLEAHPAWTGWPLIGSLRPVALALWIGAVEFAAGIFLVCGLLTRVASVASLLISLFGLFAFSDLGPGANTAHAVLVLASLVFLLKGGGAGTMDSLLGGMQRRSIEREAERDAIREAERAARGESGAVAPRL
jgi:uncharacterized membrane protein YphA (DoxX/SURF4 family)